MMNLSRIDASEAENIENEFPEEEVHIALLEPEGDKAFGLDMISQWHFGCLIEKW